MTGQNYIDQIRTDFVNIAREREIWPVINL